MKQDSKHDFRNPNLPLEQRVDDLLAKLTLPEKISLMTHESAAIERLGIPYYNWWNEALHGVARSAPATVFPQAIALAATFDINLIEETAAAISDEGRALYHEALRRGIHKQYLGITYWSPNVNIFRDPRWGRGHETYGEDPYLTGEIGAAFVRGLQGDDEMHLKTAACAKHFAVHNGPEAKRHTFDAKSNQKDLNETYLPAFKRLIDEGVVGIMCAYNRLNTEACCGSPTYLVELLRNRWQFDGYVVSDCWALNDFHENHKVTGDQAESAALAIQSGVDLNCGVVYKHLQEALDRALITESELDTALSRQLAIRFRLRMMDPEPDSHFPELTVDTVGSEKHRQLARKVAQSSMVLLKNDNNVLPLSKSIGEIFVSGNNAADINALKGNYFGVSKHYVTMLEGIAGKADPTSIVRYEQIILLDQELERVRTQQVDHVTSADAAIAVVGISGLYEGEEGDTPFSKTGGDRDRIELPENQMVYLRALREACGDKPLIVVVCSGSALAIPELHDLADAVLWAWYPGEQGGNAVADILFGDVSPSGKLPITIYNSTDDLAGFEDYRIAEGKQTYRYFEGPVLYPFGFGLSYTRFEYSNISFSKEHVQRGEGIEVSFDIRNAGTVAGEEVAQLYLAAKDVPFQTPIASLKGFQRVKLNPGETTRLSLILSPEDLVIFDDDGNPFDGPFEFRIFVGGSSPHQRAEALGIQKPEFAELKVVQKT